MIENFILDINKENPSIEGKLILPGIFYGKGEDDLY